MTLKEIFIELFESGNSVEVDGFFCKNFNETVDTELKGNDDEVINFDLVEIGGSEVSITNADLDSVSICKYGVVWTVGGYNFTFYNLETIETPF